MRRYSEKQQLLDKVFGVRIPSTNDQKPPPCKGGPSQDDPGKGTRNNRGGPDENAFNYGIGLDTLVAIGCFCLKNSPPPTIFSIQLERPDLTQAIVGDY